MREAPKPLPAERLGCRCAPRSAPPDAVPGRAELQRVGTRLDAAGIA
jgi:hypothetical protein